ncbi:MAG: hypothetical protein KAS93_08150 [Gammaproteobacteria bacterium]|nr:hypothetical protein [Gammaproteobacteria bacterium]
MPGKDTAGGLIGKMLYAGAQGYLGGLEVEWGREGQQMKAQAADRMKQMDQQRKWAHEEGVAKTAHGYAMEESKAKRGYDVADIESGRKFKAGESALERASRERVAGMRPGTRGAADGRGFKFDADAYTQATEGLEIAVDDRQSAINEWRSAGLMNKNKDKPESAFDEENPQYSAKIGRIQDSVDFLKAGGGPIGQAQGGPAQDRGGPYPMGYEPGRYDKEGGYIHPDRKPEPVEKKKGIAASKLEGLRAEKAKQIKRDETVKGAKEMAGRIGEMVSFELGPEDIVTVAGEVKDFVKKTPGMAQKFNQFMLDSGKKAIDINNAAADKIVEFARWLKGSGGLPE